MARMKVTVYFDEDIHGFLEKLAKEAVRTVPNLVEFLAVRSVADIKKKMETGLTEEDLLGRSVEDTEPKALNEKPPTAE